MYIYSVVTSVSVILNGQEPAHFSDAAGKPVPRPMVPPQVASPINLLNPDRYEFYTFNDNGDLIKRLMTVKEIQSIVAGGAGEGNMLAHHPSQLDSQKIENNVEDIVSNVQRVLNGEVDASAKRNSSDNHKLDTPDVSETWSQILPAIFGNTGEIVGPLPKPPQNIAMTTDAVLMIETSSPKTNSYQNNPNGINYDELNKRQPIEVSTPRSSFIKPGQVSSDSASGYRRKTTEAPNTSSFVTKKATTVDNTAITETFATTSSSKDLSTPTPSYINLSYDIQDADKLVTSFYIDTNTLPTEPSVNIITADTVVHIINDTTIKIPMYNEHKTESSPTLSLITTKDYITNTKLELTTPNTIKHTPTENGQLSKPNKPILLETQTQKPVQHLYVTETIPVEQQQPKQQTETLKKPTQSKTPLLAQIPSMNDISNTALPSAQNVLATSSEPSDSITETVFDTTTFPTSSTTTTTTSSKYKSTTSFTPALTSSAATSESTINALPTTKTSSTTYMYVDESEASTIAPQDSYPTEILQETSTETLSNSNEFSHMEPMHDSIQKLSAALLAENFQTTTGQVDSLTTITDFTESSQTTVTPQQISESSQTTEPPKMATSYVETFEEATEALFDSDFSFNQIMESLKDSTDTIGLLLANDENINQFVPATTEVVPANLNVIKQQSFKSEESASQYPDNLYVEESEPQIFDIPTTTESLSQNNEDDTTIQTNQVDEDIHSVVQQVNDFIDSTTSSQLTDQVAVESVTSFDKIHIPIEHGIKMSEYVEKAATVASVMKQRPIVTLDKSTRTSEETKTTEGEAKEKIVYETSVVRETSSVSMSGQSVPNNKPVLLTNSDNPSDISTEISVQSDVHEELNMADKHTTNEANDDLELNIAADILNPIGFFDEETIRHRFNELGDRVEHREDSTEVSIADDSNPITTEESASYSQEESKSTTTSSEESGSSDQSSTESSQETESNSASDDKEGSVEGVQEGVAAVNDVINSAIAGANEAAIDAALEEASRDVTTEALQITTAANDFPDSRTIWPLSTKVDLINGVTELNMLEDQSTPIVISEDIPIKLSTDETVQSSTESEIPISNKLTSEENFQSSSVEYSNESNNVIDSSEETTTRVFSQEDETTENSDEESTTRINDYFNEDVTASTEEGLKKTEPELSSADTSYSSTESFERGTDSEDASTGSTSSDEQSTEGLNESSSHGDVDIVSSESRLGVEYRKEIVNDLVGDDFKTNLETSPQKQNYQTIDTTDINIGQTTVTENKNIQNDITTVLPLYQNDDPMPASTSNPETEMKDFTKLDETTVMVELLDETTLASFKESNENNINDITLTDNATDSEAEELDNSNVTPIVELQTESALATQPPKDEQVFINLGETTTTANPSNKNEDTAQTIVPPRKNLPETQHVIQIKKQAAKIEEISSLTDSPIVTVIPHKMPPVKLSPPAHIKMPPALSSFKIKGSQASRKPAMSVKLDPAPKQALGLEESTANVSEDILEFTKLCNELAFTFWRSLTSEGISSARSLVVSPFALTSMLAMVFLGARGSTSGEMNELLRLDDMVTFNPHLIFRNITDSVENPKEAQLANSAFVRALFSDRNLGKILPFFKEKAQQYYSGHVEEVNFNLINDIVRRRTNLLVKRHTFGKIGEYLRTNNVWLNAPLAGLSANIFQTDCSKAFVNDRDGEMFFQVLPAIRQRRLIPIPAVVWKSGFTAGYDPELDATAVAFGDASNVVSTIFVMPGQQGHAAAGDNLERLESTFMQDAITKNVWRRLLTTLMERPGLEVQIPRFSHRSFVNATQGLQKMGIKNLFDFDNADLRGLTGSKANDLYISDMVQINTFSTCGEEKISDQHHVEMYPAPPIQHRNINNYEDTDGVAQGTARTQSVESEYDDLRQIGADEDRALDYPLFDEEYLGLPLPLRPRQARIPEAPRLRFDKPFLFFVRHNPTGIILYMGRFNPRLLP